MKKRLLPFLIAFSALSVSASAAFYSVFGLSHLFAGASTEVIIMAGALEFAKLVCASLLYQYWDTINKWLRAYLVSAVFILMVITSGGIYGFLSGAFEETNTQAQFLEKQVEIQTAKKLIFVEKKEDLDLEKAALVQSISDLRISLSNPTQVSYYSEDAGQVITTSSTSARKALQLELNKAIGERDNISDLINATTDSIASYDIKILDQQIGNETARELGPLKYMAELTGKPMEQIVNWFMLLIIFVFDPLAIAMVVAANMAFAQIQSKNKIEIRKEDIIPVEEKINIPPYPETNISEDDIVVTPEQEEKIRLENDLDEEGGVIEPQIIEKVVKYDDVELRKKVEGIENFIKENTNTDNYGRWSLRGGPDDLYGEKED